MAKIPATVITGFLGAGKTSIIRHMIENNHNKKLAFLINEFGDLGIDRDVLLGCGMDDCTEDDIVELSNGCICCTVADDFLPTMEKLLDRENPPEHILIETSGLALPKPLIKAFDWPTVKSRATVDGVIAVVDSKALSEGKFAHDEVMVQQQRELDENLDHENPLHEVFEDQLLCADVVVMNKADLISETEMEKLKADLKQEVRDGVLFVESSNATVSGDALLGLGVAVEDDIDNRKTHHDHHHETGEEHSHSHDEFYSFTIDLGEVKDAEALELKLQEAVKQQDILRIKGFIYNSDKPMRQVIQGVGPRFTKYFDRAWADNEPKTTRLVIIGLHHMDKDKIEKIIKG
ncbi:MAG: cobalamin biosynthesis protein CobW [Alphaproteobacteria bacterium]